MESWGKVVYQEIVEPERIVYTDAFSDAVGNITEGMPQTLITLTFLEAIRPRDMSSSSHYQN
jgi:uncharacterized protein YndB with AHSA1/START domain